MTRLDVLELIYDILAGCDTLDDAVASVLRELRNERAAERELTRQPAPDREGSDGR